MLSHPFISSFRQLGLCLLVFGGTTMAQTDGQTDGQPDGEALQSTIARERDDIARTKERIKRIEQDIAQGRKVLTNLNAEITTMELAIREAGQSSSARQDTRHEGLKRRDPRLIPMTEEATGAMIRIMNGGKLVGTAFASELKGKDVILCPTHMVNAHKNLSFADDQGRAIPVSKTVISPDGIPFIGYLPTKALGKKLELSTPNQTAKASDMAFILAHNPSSQKIVGYQCVIRGMGPDLYELEGAVFPGMLGCPVIAMDSGKAIGFVTRKVDGASALWAVGTRHQQDRHFAARADRLKDTEEIQLSRVHRESDWLNQYMLDVRMAAASLRHFGFRTSGYTQQDLQENKDHPFLKGARDTLQVRSDGRRGDPNAFFRKLINDLKKKGKMSGNFTWGNEQIYQATLRSSNQLIDAVKKEAGIRD